jgi:hypothetical protein
MALAARVGWYRAHVELRGLLKTEMDQDLTDLGDYLRERDHIRAANIMSDSNTGQAVVETEIESFTPDEAVAQAEEDVRELIFVAIRTLDHVTVEGIGAEPCAEPT